MRVRRGVQIPGRVDFLRPQGQERRSKGTEVRDGEDERARGEKKYV